MKGFLQFPPVRILIATVFVGAWIPAGQAVLNLLRSMFLITNAGIANLLALVILTPLVTLAY